MDTADVGFRQLQTLLPAAPVGHTLQFFGRAKVLSQSGLDQGEGVALPVIFDGATSGVIQYIAQGYSAPGLAALFWKDIVVPTGTTGIYHQPSISNDSSGEPITTGVGELAVYDLTAPGMV